MLKSVYLSLRKVKVLRVTVVEFGMYRYTRSGDGLGCFEVKVGANAAKLTNVIVAGQRVMTSDQRSKIKPRLRAEWVVFRDIL